MVTCISLGTDPEDVIRNAFACFDEEGTGKIHEDRLRELLTTMGDRFTDAEVSESVITWVIDLFVQLIPYVWGCLEGGGQCKSLYIVTTTSVVSFSACFTP